MSHTCPTCGNQEGSLAGLSRGFKIDPQLESSLAEIETLRAQLVETISGAERLRRMEAALHICVDTLRSAESKARHDVTEYHLDGNMVYLAINAAREALAPPIVDALAARKEKPA